MRKGFANTLLMTATVLLVVLAMYLIWTRPPPAERGSAVAPVPVTSIARQAAEPGAVVTSAPLPPVDTPLRQVFDELSRRAKAGDSAAACRLAAELERCDGIQERLAGYDDQVWRLQRAEEKNDVEVADREGRAAWKRMLDSMAPGIVQAAERCDGVRQVTAAERVALWRQSALAGNSGALAHYVVGNAFRRREMLEVLPELQRYRKEAESLALEASAQGDLQTSLVLAAAYSPRRDTGEKLFLAQVVKTDLASSLALYRRGIQLLPATATPRSREMIEANLAWLQRQATPADLARADVLGQQWAMTWAANPPAGLAKVTVNENGTVTAIDPAQCAQ
ncbi:hypothetical protein [Xanthomonas nasturtii]|uniref:Uncharacterized protein n=1 Tax=Xanthomonas nasturtii TaxID=1843581 RepID=A0ABT0LLI6_9XANT|nr:hypothetical protein [Xanthomonas nasturtii]MCL1550192.1 hypothetical protein [Xanthomonas nasturtii]MCL1557488.1 hypothetical protein [Xanthomonas nasturtii]